MTTTAAEPTTKEEFEALLESIAADVLLSLQESLAEIEDAPKPETIDSLDLDGEDFIGVFGSESGSFVFRLGDRDVLWEPYQQGNEDKSTSEVED